MKMRKKKMQRKKVRRTLRSDELRQVRGGVVSDDGVLRKKATKKKASAFLSVE